MTSGADAVVGLAPYALVRELFPDMRKTVLRFSDDEYCGCRPVRLPHAGRPADGERLARGRGRAQVAAEGG